jgi:peptidoglycan/xylan/chitin deacetylase (PgdA/CDA1 family)
LSRGLKSGLVRLLHSAGLSGKIRDWLGGQGVILLLHEIQTDPASELLTGMPVSRLAAIVASLRSEGWDIVDLDEALHRLASDAESRPFAVLTFDDGFRDNLTRALPILERLQAPFTVYVPTGALTRELFAWWLGLRALFRANDEVAIDCMDLRFSCADLAGKVAALSQASRWVHRDYRRQFELAPTFTAYGISLESLAESYFLDREELRALARHHLVTIGAHTTSHRALSTLEPEEIRREMADNRAFLQQLLDREVRHFAYPYGDARSYGAREIALAGEGGFASAVTTEASPVFPAHRRCAQALPRVAVRPDETPASLYYRASGLSWAFNAHKRARRGRLQAAN